MSVSIRRLNFLVMALTLVILLPSNESFAQLEPVELSLSTMILFSTDENPDLLMAQERQKQAEFFVGEARAGYYPQIQVNMEGGREAIDPAIGDKSNNTGKMSVLLNQNLFNGYATTSEVDRRVELQRSADLDLNSEKEQLILQVTNYYLDILHYQGIVKNAQNFIVETNKITKIVSDMFEAGAVGKAMLDYARSRQAFASVDLNEAQSSLSNAVQNLEFLTGTLPSFKAITPDQFYPDNVEKNLYLSRASKENTFMKKSKSEIRAMKHQLKSEKAGYYPAIDVAMEAKQTHNEDGDVGRSRNMKATVNLTYNIFDGFYKKNRVSRMRGKVKELEYRDQKILKELNNNINISYDKITSLRLSIKATEKEILSNKSLQVLNEENFKSGNINVIELIESAERLKQAYNKKFKLEHDLYKNTYSLLVTTAILNGKYFCETCDITL